MISWISGVAAALGAGYLLDLLLGDPRWLYHPVRLIGKVIQLLEKLLRQVFPKSRRGEEGGGMVLTGIVILFCIGFSWGILFLASKIHWTLAIAIEIFFCYQLLATKSLKTESMKVYQALKEDSLEEGRKAVSMIVGRDTEHLNEKGVAKAAIETVAENFSDGVVAPMFYMALGGPVLMFLYKGINTMDSMIGYKNETYLYFGRWAAKLDDLANFLPARLAAFFMLTAGCLAGYPVKRGWQIFRRDRFCHASPNSAQTEAVMAGLLGIQLAGDAWYFGKRYRKPYIGDPVRETEIEDIGRANRLMYLGSGIAAVLFCCLRGSAELLYGIL